MTLKHKQAHTLPNFMAEFMYVAAQKPNAFVSKRFIILSWKQAKNAYLYKWKEQKRRKRIPLRLPFLFTCMLRLHFSSTESTTLPHLDFKYKQRQDASTQRREDYRSVSLSNNGKEEELKYDCVGPLSDWSCTVATSKGLLQTGMSFISTLKENVQLYTIVQTVLKTLLIKSDYWCV